MRWRALDLELSPSGLPLDQTALGGRGQLIGPADQVGRFNAAFSLIGPAWQRHFERAGVPLPRILTIAVHPSEEGSGGQVGYGGSWGNTLMLGPDARIEFAVAPTLDRARLLHMVVHELAHLFVNQATAGERISGLAGEYAAERIGWEIALAAGLGLGLDISLEAYRKTHRAWLRPLVRISAQLRSSPPGYRSAEDLRYVRNLRWLQAAAKQITGAEAYRRGQADAGIKPAPEPAIPAVLEAALDELFAPIERWAPASSADGRGWGEFLRVAGSQMASGAGHIGPRPLASLALESQADFLACGRPRGEARRTG